MIPVVRELAKRVRIPISVDTTKAEVARQAIEAAPRSSTTFRQASVTPEC